MRIMPISAGVLALGAHVASAPVETIERRYAGHFDNDFCDVNGTTGIPPDLIQRMNRRITLDPNQAIHQKEAVLIKYKGENRTAFIEGLGYIRIPYRNCDVAYNATVSVQVYKNTLDRHPIANFTQTSLISGHCGNDTDWRHSLEYKRGCSDDKGTSTTSNSPTSTQKTGLYIASTLLMFAGWLRS